MTEREERRAERAAAAGFGVTVLACGGLAYVYLQGGQAQLPLFIDFKNPNILICRNDTSQWMRF